MSDPLSRAVLERLGRGPATLAELRAHLPKGSAESTALPSMGEEDPFGTVVTALVADGLVDDRDGTYRLAR